MFVNICFFMVTSELYKAHFCLGQLQIQLVTFVVFSRYTNTMHATSTCYIVVITDVTTPIAKKPWAPDQIDSNYWILEWS
jgi:hypothetical protein